jgi:hypothetical protein
MLEGYVCNNQKCNAYGTPYYIKYEGEMDAKCKYCKEERTALTKTEYKEPEVDAKDVMPKISTKGFTHKMNG